MAYTAIDDPSAYFKVQLYAGNGAANNAITFDDTDTDMQPDLVWIKNRDAADSNCVFDSVRGATKVLHSDATSIEATDTDTLDSFASDGFQVDADVKVNTDGENYVAWCWKESATAGFDILIFDGNETARTISHSLSAVPHLMILKARASGSDHWQVFHSAVGQLTSLQLSGAGTPDDSDGYWNDTLPTSSVFSVGDSSRVNDDGESVVAYLWAPKQGFSAMGSYKGTGTDTQFVHTGFSPAFILFKGTSNTSNWLLFDNKKGSVTPGNALYGRDEYLYPNWNYAKVDNSSDGGVDFLSNGFCLRGTASMTGSDELNEASAGYIYIAFADAPFVNSNGVPCNAK